MNTSTEPFGLPDTAPELARRFAVIMAGLGALIARRFLKMPHLSGFTVLLWKRLNRAVPRFFRALTRPPGKVRAKRARAAAPADVVRVRSARLPSGRGWLVRELGWEAAGYMCHLEVLLAEPEMQAVLARFPGAGRILRPLCRMLGIPASAATPPLVVVATAPESDMAATVVEVAGPDMPPPIERWVGPIGLPGLDGGCVIQATGR